jgi:L-ascorbate metabolism protein UlaG (beta-lactamase superfamily)
MKVQWLGHSCFVLEEKNRVIVDPFITGNPRCPVNLEEISVDVVAITHGHGDHLGDGIAIARKNDAVLVAIHEIALYAADKNVRAEGMNMGGTVRIKETDISMTPACHSSGLDETGHAVSTCPAGLVIDGGTPVYHAGDTCLFSDMRLIRDLYHPAVALLPIGGRYTMDARQAAMAAEWLQPGIAIPMHYGTFDLIAQNPEDFRRLAEARGVRVRIPELGATVEL